MTFITGVVGFFLLPDSPQKAWFLNDREREAAVARMLRDASSEVGTGFNLRDCFRSWHDWKFPIWCIITFTYPVAYATAMNFFPLVCSWHRLATTCLTGTDRRTIRILHCQNQSVDGCTKPRRRGHTPMRRQILRSFPRKNIPHRIVLTISMVGMIILAAIDVLNNKAVAYFACFLMAAGAYIPSCLVHAWHNNNNLHENSRAANTGFFVGLGNLAGVLSAATFELNMRLSESLTGL